MQLKIVPLHSFQHHCRITERRQEVRWQQGSQQQQPLQPLLFTAQPGTFPATQPPCDLRVTAVTLLDIVTSQPRAAVMMRTRHMDSNPKTTAEREGEPEFNLLHASGLQGAAC